MRCPYCGGLNPDNTSYCLRCGRNVSAQQPAIQHPPAQPISQRPASPPPGQGNSQPAIPPTYQQPQRPAYPPPVNPRPVAPQQAPPASRTQETRPQRPRVSTVTPIAPEPPAPEPPAPFPPRTMAQLNELEQGALTYTFVNDNGGYGKKKIIRIAFRRCAPWQQIATLLRALKEYDATKFDTVIIQGVYDNDNNSYEYTNGQIIFDRNVRLGSQILTRYQIETDNGFSSDSIRFVLAE